MNTPWKLLDLLNEASGFFASQGIENPRLQAELLLAAAVGMKRLDLYLQFERTVVEDEVARFRGYVRERLAGVPVQYITGTASFRLLELEVSESVLIPRPETEVLVDCALEFLAARENPTVLDLGCGSGAIAVSIAHEEPSARVTAVDIDRDSLTTTRRNAAACGVGGRLRIARSDLLSAFAPGDHFEAVVCNPPYIPSAEIGLLDAEVRDFEPRRALDGGPDGLDFYRRLAVSAGSVLAPDGELLLEVGDGQASEVSGILEESGDFTTVGVRPDLAGTPRVVLARHSAAVARLA